MCLTGEVVVEGRLLVVGEIEVVGQLGVLAGHGVDALHGGHDASLLAVAAHLKVLFLHVAGTGFEHEACNLEVGESGGLHLGEELVGELFQLVEGHELVLQVDDALESLEEPHVDLGELLDALDGVTLLQGLSDGEDAQVGGVLQGVVEVVEAGVVVAHESVHALSDHAQTLLDHLLEGTSDRHDLAHRLHARADVSAHAGKLSEVPAGYFANHIVELRSHIGRVGCAHLANLVEGVAQGYLGGHEGEGIAGGLGGQCARAAQSGVDLDDAVVVGLGVEGKLYVALAHDVQMAHAADGNLLQHLHLLVGQRACGSHDDALAGMDAQGVEVLHRGHGEAMVVGVAYALELNLLPSLEAFLDQYLRGEGECALCQFYESLLVGADAAAQSAQGVGRANHDGETDGAGSLQGVVHVLNGVADGCLELYLVELLDKQVAVLGVHDGLDAGAEHLHTILFQGAVLVELSTTVQGGLSAEGKQYAVGALFLDDLCDEVGGHRLEIHFVGNTLRGLNGGNVRIDKHAGDALLAQSLQGLRAGVVEFTCLSDFQCARTQYEHFVEFSLHDLFEYVIL